MLTRQEVLGQLTNAKNNYILGLAALSLFSTRQAIERLRQNHASFGCYTVQFEQVARLLSSKSDREVALKEFLTMLLRALLKEPFELVKEYASQTNQEQLFTSQPWYQFARLIRNCVSHNFQFQLSGYDRSVIPVSWNGRTIDISMDKQPLAIDFLGYDGSWELFHELDSFAVSFLQ